MKTLAVAAALMIVTGCGSNHFDDSDAATDAAPPFDAPSFSDVVDAGCGLECNVVACDGGVHTTISGTVYDPGGNNPLYDVLVYIPKFPNDPLPTITHGPSCDVCAATISNVVAVTLSDANGKFTLTDVPVGSNIPLVVQIGKWRRAYTMPSPVVACQDNAFPNPTQPADRLRLPAKQSEGDMPRIALATGCDPMNDLFSKVGIDGSEFTASTGSGAVHVYQGKQSDFPLTGSTDAYAFWNDANAMNQYDILINACECAPNPRGNTAHTNLDTYLNAGGRFFGSHYQINWFSGLLDGATEPAPADMENAANWASDWGIPGAGPFAIDTTFPKGKAMADWMQGVFPNDAYASVPIDPQTSIVEDIVSTKPGLSQQWIYDSSDQVPAYISINTPTTSAPDKRCGRAVLADLHVGSTSTLSITEQEAALEFMFFDLAACVIDDAKPPPVPQPN